MIRLPVIQGFPVSIDDDIRQVLEICKGDLKAALRMVLVANAYYEEEIARLKQEASTGYGRGKVRKPAQKQAG
ncbi:hypothetical protein DW352_02780 [Pseudolabrys taiwanensis]|uniref:Uncharacterized protein n=1 Tax=Pseudolabrys taiwanensis TaxID=331696 RepID=A0A345ZRJ0_9HYPH|nr:hypothetical protein DW352_02780 [Pseudolabrys taiwanensis]